MKENKRLFYLSIIVSLITLTISIILHFIVGGDIAEYISSIMLNIFAGSIMLIFTSLIYYFVERRRNIEKLMNYALDLRNLFNKLAYLEEDTYTDYSDFKKYYGKQEEYKNIDLKKLYNNLKKSDEEKRYKKMECIMQTYIQIRNFDLKDFWSIYDQLHFIFDFKNKKRFKIYRMIFEYTHELKNKIEEKVYHFNIYFNSDGHGNKKVNYQFVRELQKNIYYHEELPITSKRKWNVDLKERNYSCSYNNVAGIKSITSNSVVEYYNNIFDELGKIAYFNKNYDIKK